MLPQIPEETHIILPSVAEYGIPHASLCWVAAWPLAFWHHVSTELQFLLLGLWTSSTGSTATVLAVISSWKDHALFAPFLQTSVSFMSARSVLDTFASTVMAKASVTFQMFHHNTLACLKHKDFFRQILPGAFLSHRLRYSALRKFVALSCLVASILFPLHGKRCVIYPLIFLSTLQFLRYKLYNENV